MFKRVFFLIGEGFRLFLGTKYWNFFSIFVLTFFLLILGLFIQSVDLFDDFILSIEKDIEVELFLSDTVSSEFAVSFSNELLNMPEIDTAFIVTKEEALEYFTSHFSDVSLPGDFNPLPMSIILRMREDFIDEKASEVFFEKLSSYEFVEYMYYNKSLIDAISRFKLYFNVAFPFVLIFIIGAGGFILYNAILHSMTFKKPFVDTVFFLGGSTLAFKIPFVVEGFLISLIAGSLAATLFIALNKFVLSYIDFLNQAVIWTISPGILLISILLGFLFTLLSLRR